MTLQVFGPPKTKHKLTKNQIHQERYPSSGSIQKKNITEKPEAKKAKIEATMPIT